MNSMLKVNYKVPSTPIQGKGSQGCVLQSCVISGRGTLYYRRSSVCKWGVQGCRFLDFDGGDINILIKLLTLIVKKLRLNHVL